MNTSTLARGLRANFVLKQHVDSSSLDDVMDLIATFPDAVIEFATFTRNVGVLPRRKTVIFEVREY
jgi:hypothetical protein